MRRRELLLLGGAMTAARSLRAQQKAMPVIGFLIGGSLFGRAAPALAAFLQGLSETAMSRARTSPSNIVGRAANTIDCRSWQPIWFSVR
jgi:hypothetical protein